MANRTLARADDNPGEILADGELHKTGMWDEVTIERSSAGAPGLVFVITRYDNGQLCDQMCVSVPDGKEFLLPVIRFLSGNDPEPWSGNQGDRYAHPQDCGRESAEVIFAPRLGYNQNQDDYA